MQHGEVERFQVCNLEGLFLDNQPTIFNPILKMFCNFSLQLNMAKRRHKVFFTPLTPVPPVAGCNEH